MSTTRAQSLLQELEAEHNATRRCLESIPESLYEYKPHPTSISMGYLVLLVTEIPVWIYHMIVDGEIDLATFKHISPGKTADTVAHFEENMKKAREALQATNDEALEENFTLKSNGKAIYSSPKKIDIGTTINHWVHHRGQLTVYMRLNDIPVPSIYGPSGDDKSFNVPK